MSSRPSKYVFEAIKGQVVFKFLAAHRVPDNSSLARDPPNEDIMLINPQKGCEMFFHDASKSPTGVRKEDAQDNVVGTEILFVSSGNALSRILSPSQRSAQIVYQNVKLSSSS